MEFCLVLPGHVYLLLQSFDPVPVDPLSGPQRPLGLLEAAAEPLALPLGLLALPRQALALAVRLLQISQLSLSSTEDTEQDRHEKRETEGTVAVARGPSLPMRQSFDLEIRKCGHQTTLLGLTWREH